MAAKVIRQNDERDPTGICCPFTGKRLHPDEESELEPPRTLLFAYYGMAGEYGHLRRRAAVLRGLLGRDGDDPTPEELIPRLPRSVVVIESDGGWNGVNWYGFVAPPARAPGSRKKARSPKTRLARTGPGPAKKRRKPGREA